MDDGAFRVAEEQVHIARERLRRVRVVLLRRMADEVEAARPTADLDALGLRWNRSATAVDHAAARIDEAMEMLRMCGVEVAEQASAIDALEQEVIRCANV